MNEVQEWTFCLVYVWLYMPRRGKPDVASRDNISGSPTPYIFIFSWLSSRVLLKLVHSFLNPAQHNTFTAFQLQLGMGLRGDHGYIARWIDLSVVTPPPPSKQLHPKSQHFHMLSRSGQ